jgi:putative addiction module component (TIGR02574 family)
MHDQVTEIAQRGKALLPQDRSRLVDILLESLHEPVIAEVEAAWALEIERRLAEYDRGEANSIDADDFFAKARSIAR